jgi:hypothetical protein
MRPKLPIQKGSICRHRQMYSLKEDLCYNPLYTSYIPLLTLSLLSNTFFFFLVSSKNWSQGNNAFLSDLIEQAREGQTGEKTERHLIVLEISSKEE